jgi:hypothetical protein
MSNANPSIWQPIGPAPIQNPFYGFLNYASPVGSGQAAGAMHGLAVAQGGPGHDAWLYAGSVNGGVWGRPYDSASDSWGSWRWLSEPPAYSGAQSITDLAVSPDQRWLAVGRGVFSNFIGVGGDIQAPLQLAERSSNGDLRWLRVADERQAALWNQPVQALQWAGNLLLVGTNQGLYVGQMGASGELSTLQRATALPADVRAIDVGPSGRVYAAYSNATGAAVITATTAELQTDPTLWQLLQGSDNLAAGSDNLRLGISNDPGTGHDVVFLGTSKTVEDKPGVSRSRIEAIHRGTFGQDATRPTWQSAAVGEQIGTDQANPTNFSFAADPTDARRVFAGGNRFPNFGGISGLVAVQFADDGSHTLNYMGVPLSSPNHTSPHADSRDIAFLQTRAGLRILESDDGGIYQKGIELEAPWVSLNDGLRTTEVYAADWSHIGDLSIAAMQDNSVSIGTSGSRPTWLNVYSGDGSIARFDDGISGSDGLSRAYFASQKYDEGQGLSVATFDDNGIRKSTQYTNLTVIDQYGNPISFKDYDYNWIDGGYPFYPPVETSAYRAGDYVMAGVRNVYEAIIPHWNFANGDEILLRPLIPDDPSLNAQRQFTAISVGSTAVQTSPQAKPHSWDVVYASFIAPETSTSKLYGRLAGQADNGWLDPNIYGLKDLTPTNLLNSDQVITGITHNPDRPEQIYLTVSAIDLITTPREVSQTFQQPSQILYSPDGGKSWQMIASSGVGGLASTGVFQDLVFVPATNGNTAELFVSGFGGIWSTSVNADGIPSDFSLNSWLGLPVQQPLDLWTTDLNYDPVDGVLIASTLGQGSWVLQRQPGSDTPAAPPPGLSISSTMLPQELASYQNRKGRKVFGNVNVHLERSEANQNATVTVDLELLSPDAWRQQFGVGFGDTETLIFPPGVNDLTFFISPTNKNITVPELTLQARLTNAQNAAITQGELNVRLYPNAETQGFYQEANGVFYAGESDSIPLAVLLPAASLQPGDSLWWYKVDANNGSLAVLDAQGNNQVMVKPTDAQYLALVSQRLQPLGTATELNDPLAFNAEQAKAAFDNPAAVLASEHRSSGGLLSLPMTDLAEGQRFALALKHATGELQVSPLGFAVDSQLDTLASFTEGGLNRQVVLAAGRGELFVVDPFLFGSGALSNQLTLTMDVTRVSPLASSYGLFRVDDLTGAFDTNGDGIAELKPGAPTYASEALRRSLTNSLDGITGSTIPGYAESVSQQVTLASSNIYAAYITPGRQMTPGRSGRQRVASLAHQAPTTDEIYFSIAKANGDGDLKHVSMGTGYFAFDDTSGGGDNDRNDLLLRLSAIAAPL